MPAELRFNPMKSIAELSAERARLIEIYGDNPGWSRESGAALWVLNWAMGWPGYDQPYSEIIQEVAK